MGCQRVLRAFAAVTIAAVALGVGSAAQAMPARTGARAAKFAPRVHRAWGLVPALGQVSIPVLSNPPLLFHGGPVMHGIHVHTVFWAPAGYAFPPAPTDGAPSYVGLLERFFADAARSSGSASNVFSVLEEYGDTSGEGADAISYSPATDAITDTDRYPPATQCESPAGLPVCLSSDQVQQELDGVIARQDPTARGLHDLWVLLLPPNVDTCVTNPMCGTDAFAGYHSEFDLGHGPTLYALVVNPLIEGVPPAGMDPEGNAVAEVAANVAAHETVEAGTDPEGTGWVDSSGAEIGDKCQASNGAILGYAANGAPYNQLLAGDPFLVQTMWSDAASACVGHGSPAPAPALPTVAMRQFSALVRGNVGVAHAGIGVRIKLLRDGTLVARGSARTDARGAWAATLRARSSGVSAAVGDDRDELDVSYGAGGPPAESILTGQATSTGWSALDSGFALGHGTVAVSPCSQVGVLRITIDGRPTQDPVTTCEASTNVSTVAAGPLGPGTSALLSSTDNRAGTPADAAGALVDLTIAMGEPDSASQGGFNPTTSLVATGFPTCDADLGRQTVSCTGLVPGARYHLRGARRALAARADGSGQARFAARGQAAWLAGGAVLELRNRVGRLLTSLHVARLRVALNDAGGVAGGTCQPGEYWGSPSAPEPPVFVLGGFPFVSESPSGPSALCPLTGRARGLRGALMQSDSFSGGTTTTEVPGFALVSPANAATLYGPFLVLAQLGSGPHRSARVGVQITRAGARRPTVSLRDVNQGQGVRVAGLRPGLYHAIWTVTDRTGDTRTLHTYFVQEP